MEILKKLEIPYREEKLYIRALTHTSFANEENCQSYERLEYLGDAILEFIMSEYLYKNTDYPEGNMTKLRSHYVCENALYEYSLLLGLNEYIRFGKGQIGDGKYCKAIVADVFESFIAAMYLDIGLNAVKDFIYKHIIPLIENNELDFFNDYKSILQELVQTDKKSLEYEIVNEAGPAHDKKFSAVVKIDEIIYGRGTAKSKKEAEQLAAKDALQKAQNE